MITRDDLKQYLEIDPGDHFDDDRLNMSVRAAHDFITVARPDRDWRHPSDSELLGLMQLAAAFFREFGSNGTENAADYGFGGPMPVIPPHTQQLLGIGRHFGPVVA